MVASNEDAVQPGIAATGPAQEGGIAVTDFTLKPYLIRLYLGGFILFFLNKFLLRPFVLDNNFPDWADTFVLSVPNTIETIFGMGIIGAALSVAREKFRNRLGGVPDLAIYLCTLTITATYVLTQEFRLHNLGGRNVFDPNDAIASVIGLVVMFLLFVRFGIIEQSRPVA